jgi:hypothetical protein
MRRAAAAEQGGGDAAPLADGSQLHQMGRAGPFRFPLAVDFWAEGQDFCIAGPSPAALETDAEPVEPRGAHAAMSKT